MNDAYEARNPCSSYFEARNRRWQGYYDNLIVPAKEQLEVYLSDVGDMHKKHQDVCTSDQLTHEDKWELLKYIDDFINQLSDKRDDAWKNLRSLEEQVHANILSEGRQ